MHQLSKVRRRQLPKDKTFDFAGAQMNYSVLGSGKEVILLHGSMIHDPWNGFEKELAKSYRVYLPHLPGFGGSDVVNKRLHNTELFTESLGSFIKKNGLTKAPIIALSLGAVVALKSAVHGDTAGKLVLIGMPVKVDSRKLRLALLLPVWLRRLLCATVWGRKTILIPVLKEIIGINDTDRGKKLLDELASTDTRALVDLDVYREIELQMPTLLTKLKNEVVYIYGSKDKLLESVKDLLKNLTVIQGATHDIFQSQPKKILLVLQDILK